MDIAIHALAAFKEKRTGVEEYTYQLIRHIAMLPGAHKHRFFLYSPFTSHALDDLPDNFHIQTLRWPALWTQTRFAWEIRVRHMRDRVFIPAHVLPLMCPASSVVVIHGLEFERFPSHYPYARRMFLRNITRYSTTHASLIITPSQSTKEDLVSLYGGDERKIHVIPLGVDVGEFSHKEYAPREVQDPYLLFIGRIEKKKNISGIIRAFEYVRKNTPDPLKLVLIGIPGFGYKDIKKEIAASPYASEIIETGFVTTEKKRAFLQHASMLVFPSWYEGFGLPVLEAQAAGTPVITSNLSSLPEIAGDGALFVDPHDTSLLSEAIIALLNNLSLRDAFVARGRENSARFSWERTARETFSLLTRM